MRRVNIIAAASEITRPHHSLIGYLLFACTFWPILPIVADIVWLSPRRALGAFAAAHTAGLYVAPVPRWGVVAGA